MARYHIGKDGAPSICKAQPGNCPFGSDKDHFTTYEDAQKVADKINEEQARKRMNAESYDEFSMRAIDGKGHEIYKKKMPLFKRMFYNIVDNINLNKKQEEVKKKDPRNAFKTFQEESRNYIDNFTGNTEEIEKVASLTTVIDDMSYFTTSPEYFREEMRRQEFLGNYTDLLNDFNSDLSNIRDFSGQEELIEKYNNRINELNTFLSEHIDKDKIEKTTITKYNIMKEEMPLSEQYKGLIKNITTDETGMKIKKMDDKFMRIYGYADILTKEDTLYTTVSISRMPKKGDRINPEDVSLMGYLSEDAARKKVQKMSDLSRKEVIIKYQDYAAGAKLENVVNDLSKSSSQARVSEEMKEYLGDPDEYNYDSYLLKEKIKENQYFLCNNHFIGGRVKNVEEKDGIIYVEITK